MDSQPGGAGFAALGHGGGWAATVDVLAGRGMLTGLDP
jgi:hypothetical protein